MTDRYVVKEGVRLAFKGRESVALILRDAALEMSIDLFLIAMAFAMPTTIEQAYRLLEPDGNLEEFDRAVRQLLDQGVLEQERTRDQASLIELLSSRVDKAILSAHLRRGDLVVIPDAFPMDLAKEVQRDLLATYWKTSDGQGFLYSAVESLDGRSPTLTRVHDMWQASKSVMTELSGEDCSGESRASASWYRQRDFASPHNDSTSRSKSVAFNWYLADDWKVNWGGSLFWGPTGQHIFPLFNTVVLFKVLPTNVHAVCSVSTQAMSRRIAVNGFWQRSVPFDPLLIPSTASAPLVTRQTYDVGDGNSAVVVL
jgi:hypothetical protein